MRRIPTTYREAKELAEEARARAYARRDRAIYLEKAHRAYWQARVATRWWEFWKPTGPPLFLPFEVAVDRRLASDPDYKGAISDNQWYIQQAIMYGVGELGPIPAPYVPDTWPVPAN